MASPEKILLRGEMPPLEKMNMQELLEECKMWRNLWNWLDSGVKYYLARTGSICGVMIRNYHRYIGTLLECKFDLVSIEIGTYEKVYDITDGRYYYERKIVKIPAGQITSIDWIAERITEEELLEKNEEKNREEEEAVGGVTRA